MRVIAVAVLLLFSPAARGAETWTLGQAIRHALSHNPDARLALQRIAAAQAGLRQANAAFWPQLQLQSSYIYTNNPVTVFGAVLNQETLTDAFPTGDFSQVPSADNFQLQGMVRVPLFVGGRNVANRRVVRAQTEAAEQQAEAVRRSLAFEVARAYLTLLKSRAFIEASKAAVGAFEHNVVIARKRFKAGTLLKADVLDVEVRLARAREELVRAENARALAQRVLRNLLGIDRGTITVADVDPQLERPKAGARWRRAEIAAVSKALEAAQAGLRRARAGYFPRLSAFASLVFDAGAKHGGSGLSYTTGAMLQWDLWDGMATRAHVEQANAALATAHERERKLRLAIDLEVEQARIHLREARERLAVTEKVISQAEQSVRLTRARFEQGLALATQLIDAETALTGARLRRAESEADRRIAIAALRKALGLDLL